MQNALALPDTVQQHTQLNIYDLYRGIQHKKQKRNATYNAVLHKCHAYIKKAADAELFTALYVVPEFVIGVPLYDINHCTAYIITQLRANGFIVIYYYPRTLYISWDVHELSNRKAAPADKPPPSQQQLPMSDPVAEIIQPVYQAPQWDPRPAIPQAKYSDLVLPPPQTANTSTSLGRSFSQTQTQQMQMQTQTQQPFAQYMTKFKPSGKFVMNLM